MFPSQQLPVWDIPLSQLPLLLVPLKPRRLSREHQANKLSHATLCGVNILHGKLHPTYLSSGPAGSPCWAANPLWQPQCQQRPHHTAVVPTSHTDILLPVSQATAHSVAKRTYSRLNHRNPHFMNTEHEVWIPPPQPPTLITLEQHSSPFGTIRDNRGSPHGQG